MSKVEVPEVLSKHEYLKLPPHERELYVREILRKTVNGNPHGVTVPLLAKKLPFDPRTIEKHLSILTYTNEIYTVKIGPTVLWIPNARAMHAVIEKSVKTDGREYCAYLLRNRLGEFVFVQEKKKTQFVQDVGGGILIPLSYFNEFVKYLDEVAKQIRSMSEGIG